MKKITTLLFAVLLFAVIQTTFAANITISLVGFTYSPANTTANVGDVVTIAANANHPLVQVSQADWNTNTPTAVGGWTNQTTAYTFTVTTAGTFYYGCANHMATMQMKGMITMNATGIQQTTAAAYSISLYPNPVTNGDLTVKAEGYNTVGGKVMIYSEQGKLLDTYELTGIETPIKTKLPSGVYFYSVMIDNKAVQRNKFVVTLSK